MFNCLDSGKVSVPVKSLKIRVLPASNETNNLANNTTNTENTTSTETNNTSTENTNTAANYTETSELKYSILPVSAYSNSNPIPMNITMPSGVVFKIQIGAFKSRIRQNAFKGLNPITGEKLPASAYTRYLVGLFQTLEGSRLALSEVKTMGYKDAFIVAYKNGKRIPIYQAKNAINPSSSEYKNLAQAEVSALKNRTTNNTNTNNSTASNASTENTYTSETSSTNKIVEAINVNTIDGLFYTVQIGVYKKPIAHSKLRNLKPIYEEKTEYGFIRYTTGIFNDRNKAVSEKNRIVNLGIKDAFVTAYYKGKKVSGSELRKLISEQTKFANTSDVKLPEQKPEQNSTINTANANIVFKVQIGAYKENVPLSEVTALISASRLNELNNYKDEKGFTIYTVGNFKEYSGALSLKEILVNEGVADAFITAYNNGKKVSVKDAIDALGR